MSGAVEGVLPALARYEKFTDLNWLIKPERASVEEPICP